MTPRAISAQRNSVRKRAPRVGGRRVGSRRREVGAGGDVPEARPGEGGRRSGGAQGDVLEVMATKVIRGGNRCSPQRAINTPELIAVWSGGGACLLDPEQRQASCHVRRE